MDNLSPFAFAVIFPIVSFVALYICYIRPGYEEDKLDRDTPGIIND